mmetsp:Transcript_9121/g.13220  ORF Transcript_9121/g.13220 Transcript_9121/m.13220 type:complete len:256 (+) Transcript_9121:94-861(+)|eukprot:CAMPEP_0195508466 /NCGR_PEP_ID=MMETSP0794_2-20130614/1666_1 /TAXON_ID=515487 /ORGANISM="Stephanopyxis turris, Strain CCMP 815" /LENGTH=255 /DNA_ID=CAMNT_0040635431 /DNA_START=49 /DNA_END=816 /DNA_ORIENTATION=+
MLPLLLVLVASTFFHVESFVVSPQFSRTSSCATANIGQNSALAATKEEIAALKAQTEKEASKFFTGGAFDKLDDEAAAIASKFRTVKDLGWTAPEKIRGAARPRHRAFGGEGEKPVQLKPNYDESNPNCVEKWLTQEEFYAKAKNDSPAADTVFVALAGGGAFAERSVVEQKLQEWRPNGKVFDNAAFKKSVKEGRTGLAIGWGIYGSIILTAAVGIVAPTNPLQKALEAGIDALRDSAGLSYDASLLGLESFFL